MAGRSSLQLADPALRISEPAAAPTEEVAVFDDLRDTLHEFQRTHGSWPWDQRRADRSAETTNIYRTGRPRVSAAKNDLLRRAALPNESGRRSILLPAGASASPPATALPAHTEKPVRLAIIGTGRRGWAHLAFLKTLPQFQVLALADPTPGNVDRAASPAPGTKTYSDYRKLLAERNDIDAVVVITPSFLHAEATIAALNRGVPVACETRQRQSIPRRLESAKLGVQGPENRDRDELVPPDFDGEKRATGDGIHEIDSLNWIINAKSARVMASGGKDVFKHRERIDNAAILVQYENGVRLSFDFCLFAPNAGPPAAGWC